MPNSIPNEANNTPPAAADNMLMATVYQFKSNKKHQESFRSVVARFSVEDPRPSTRWHISGQWLLVAVKFVTAYGGYIVKIL